MNIDEALIERVCKLSRLELTSDEKKEFSHQISDILEYVEKINTLDTSAIEPADHIVELKNIMREDITGESVKQAELEKIAPQFSDGHIVVPKIIDGNE